MPDHSTQPQLQPRPLPPLEPDPLVSVLVANYNYARYLPECLESLLTQTYSRFEAIICDDGSNDESLDVLSAYAARDTRILSVAKENGGMASALNSAYARATGQVIAFLDADDVWYPTKLERTVATFRASPAATLVTHQLRAEDSQHGVVRDTLPPRLDGGWLAPRCINGECLRLPPCSALALRAEAAEALFPIPLAFRSSADRIVQEGGLLFGETAPITEVLGLYRVHNNNLTGLAGPLDEAAIRRTLAFLESVWSTRAALVQKLHGINVPVERWRIAEGAEYELALALVSGNPSTRPDFRTITDRKRRFAWSILTHLPGPLAVRGLRFWWQPGPIKRIADSFSRIFA